MTSRRCNPWTSGDDWEVARRHGLKETPHVMAKGMKRAPGAIYDAHTRLKLKPHVKNEKRAEAVKESKKTAAVPHHRMPAADVPEKLNPYTLAQHYLVDACVWNGKPKRLAERNGMYFLDGYPTDLVGIMRAVNAERAKMGQEQIGYNPAWIIKSP